MRYDSTRKCPKCLGPASVRYMDRGFFYGKLQRTCQQCGYVWHDEPLDEEEDKTGSTYVPKRILR